METITKLLEKETIADGTMLFTFEKPEGFIYKPGQSIDLTLIDPPYSDEKGNVRSFSIVSSPFETSLSIATRMRDSAFKNILKELPLDSELKIAGPFGDFTLHNNPSKIAVFLAGGIGITPFYSIIKHASKEGLPHKIYLFYSNRSSKDTAFLEDIENLSIYNKKFEPVLTMTNLDGKNDIIWKGERGFISKEMISKYLALPAPAVFYIAGPEAMVSAMRNVLHELAIDDDDIRAEEFPGY